MISISKLEDLVTMLDGDEQRGDKWWRLTTSVTLYQTVREVIRTGVVCNWQSLHQLVANWKEYIDWKIIPKQQPDELWKWNLCRSILWCGEQAATNAHLFETEISRVGFNWSQSNKRESIKLNAGELDENKPDKSDEFKPDEDWAWGCIRTLLGKITKGYFISVPIALRDKNGSGFLATLTLELLSSGGGALFHDPIHAFSTIPNKTFRDSMQTAWTLAKKVASTEGIDTVRIDGQWRLTRGIARLIDNQGPPQEGEPVSEVRGSSASGAAAWGWWFALHNKIPDPEIIILAQVDEYGNFSDVGGIEAKVTAIVDEGKERFDTIVVADEMNKIEAQKTLDRFPEKSIRVVKIGDRVANCD